MCAVATTSTFALTAASSMALLRKTPHMLHEVSSRSSFQSRAWSRLNPKSPLYETMTSSTPSSLAERTGVLDRLVAVSA